MTLKVFFLCLLLSSISVIITYATMSSKANSLDAGFSHSSFSDEINVDEIEKNISEKITFLNKFTESLTNHLKEKRYAEAEELSRKFVEYEAKTGRIGEGFLLRSLREQEKYRGYIEVITARALSCRMTIDSLRDSLEIYPNIKDLSQEDEKAYKNAAQIVAESAGMNSIKW